MNASAKAVRLVNTKRGSQILYLISVPIVGAEGSNDSSHNQDSFFLVTAGLLMGTGNADGTH